MNQKWDINTLRNVNEGRKFMEEIEAELNMHETINDLDQE